MRMPIAGSSAARRLRTLTSSSSERSRSRSRTTAAAEPAVMSAPYADEVPPIRPPRATVVAVTIERTDRALRWAAGALAAIVIGVLRRR